MNDKQKIPVSKTFDKNSEEDVKYMLWKLYPQAMEDEVDVKEVIGWARVVFSIKCEKCGRTYPRTTYSRRKIHLCDYCNYQQQMKEKAKKLAEADKIETPKERRFEKAIRKIAEQVENIEEYRKSIEIARTRAERYDSVPEAMVAIELLKLGFCITPQQKIGRYNVDFAIPKYKTIIEVDGAIYHSKSKDVARDANIQSILGFDWKIIHIPAELISLDVTKLKACLPFRQLT